MEFLIFLLISTFGICSGLDIDGVRLVEGKDVTSGRVEVSVNGEWGTVCDDQWDDDDAEVVCRYLGYAGAMAARGLAFYGQGTGSILLDDVQCDGTELSLNDCNANRIGENDCSHGEDAGVECIVIENIRLVDGSTSNVGRVEVMVNGEWGTVCDDLWDISDAHVVCRQLGFTSAITERGYAYFGEGSGRTWLDNVECIGTEGTLQDCPKNKIGEENCGHYEDAGVECTPIDTNPALPYREDNQCGGDWLAPNGQVAQCNPDGIYPCCSPYNWCGITSEHCDCEECIDYRDHDPALPYREDNQCGGDWLAPNGEVAQCNPDGIYPCCSPYNWCGITSDHCDCEECIDYRAVPYRVDYQCGESLQRDNQCGGDWLAPNGQVAQCNPDGIYPCCSPTTGVASPRNIVTAKNVLIIETMFQHKPYASAVLFAAVLLGKLHAASVTLPKCMCSVMKTLHHPALPYREDNQCGGDWLAPNGEVAQCNPDGIYPCCSPYNWCGITSDHCDCEECIDYRAVPYRVDYQCGDPALPYREDNQCGGDWLAPNGEVAQCNPDGIYPCCSPYNWCGITSDHCDCEECIDYRAVPYRVDYQCGGDWLAPNGEVAQCNPDGIYPCCSPYNWCGITSDHCDCEECIDYRAVPYRVDYQCGGDWLAPNGEVAQCNPDGIYPCCSPYNWCGITSEHCDCEECIDYRDHVIENIRLVGGKTSNVGRVEVMVNGEWGTVCDDVWDIYDAQVVCRQLGFTGAIVVRSNAYFGEGSGRTWLDNVECIGTEGTLQDCTKNKLGDENCGHHEDAGVECTPLDTESTTANIRLVNGSTSNVGRVEVMVNGEWGTVCDDLWDISDAQVVCTQLGFTGAITERRYAYFGEGSGRTWLDNVECIGTEGTLQDCPKNNIGEENCGHHEDAGVECTPIVIENIRLVDGSTSNIGRVEVMVNGEWGTVCDDFWDINDAQVVCRQLGFTGAITERGYAYFGEGSGRTWLDNVECIGTEGTLQDCPKNNIGDENCGHYEDAGVECTPIDTESRTTTTVRLIGGNSALEGRVEVYVNNEWGTVCDDGWGLDEANVICNQLGFGNAISAPSSAFFGQGGGTIHLDDVSCSGLESSLLDCGHRGIDMHNCRHSEDAGVVCSQASEDIRLEGGESPYEGRVEVYLNNQWGTICDDEWDMFDAEVICRQLGFGDAVSAPSRARYGQGTGPIHLDNLQCIGTEERITDCNHNGIGIENCNHHEDASVVCGSSQATNESIPSIRLVGGASPTEGRVELQIGGQWGTICDDHWDLVDATVACRQLGFGIATAYTTRAYFGRGQGDIFLDDVQCTGREVDLLSCGHRPIGLHNCGHSEDAGVICSPGIRLVGGNQAHEGRVELFYNGGWGTICDDLWDINDANVVCRQLGYGSASEAATSARFGEGSGAILFDDVSCTGNEAMVFQCSHRGIGSHDCGHNEDAGVICQLDSTLNTLRLVGGSSESEGRVEIFHAGQWGTICDDRWDINDAQVVCRQLGYVAASSASSLAHYGAGSGPIFMDNVGCTGFESSLMECSHSGLGNHNCGHHEDAGVSCTASRAIRFVNGSSFNEGRVELLINGEWGTICDDYWDINDANVLCKENGFPSAISAVGSSHFGRGSGPIHLDDVDCSGQETSIFNCRVNQQSNCDHSEDAGVVCESPVHLVGTENDNAGRVEVFVEGTWGTICDNDWDINDANVVCRQLGYSGATEAFNGAFFGQGSGPIVLDQVQCDGDERYVLECSHSTLGDTNCGHHQDAGLSCGVPVRLVGASVPYEGRVEIYYQGAWGTVCDDSWDIADANVVCQQLGFGAASQSFSNAHFGEGNGLILLDEVRCTGAEPTLLDCPHNRIGYHNCRHHEDAGVSCQSPDAVRIVGGKADNEGRVEVFHDGQWGTICDDQWDLNDANVVCRQLGYSAARSANTAGVSNPGTGPIHLDDLECTGEETDIFECSHPGIAVTNCNHEEDAGVVCAEQASEDIRLEGGESPYEGRVEVYLNNQWGTICDDEWDMFDAEVICRQLGFGDAVSAPSRARYGQGQGDIFLDDVQCTGREVDLLSCGHRPIGLHNCGHSEDAGVICSPGIRLVGGNQAHEGRVELFYNGGWGTICDDLWDINDANVVCRQLGYGSASEAATNARFGEGSGAILFDDVSCTGNEAMVFQCSHRGIGSHDCGHNEDAGVVCQLDNAVRIVGGKADNEGRVEGFHDGQWGTICDDQWDLNDANVVCRQLGYSAARSANTAGVSNPGTGPIHLDDLECTGEETDIFECSHPGIAVTNCNHEEDAGVVCAEQVRLIGGRSATEGRIEMYIGGQWGTVCDDDWGREDAEVVCRQLGFSTVIAFYGEAHFGEGTGDIFFDDLNCDGEDSLVSCPHAGLGVHGCDHNEDAGVSCGNECDYSRSIAVPMFQVM
ncbi:putative scavenger receptor cysteine-rich protein type 12 isoform X1 [Apostichopus japonicus]|uniref:Putative scavenger receptor cysteine-rich protein type 12 isoform X1 n=1 Tax=Stichopus japonicus TaxID=307972 RepID=A0A2G8KPC6_STIJA|nr:putative scavenger receptor cysteine-rich protein type 12 isoform X1 [Apostichopus japonicus]